VEAERQKVEAASIHASEVARLKDELGRLQRNEATSGKTEDSRKLKKRLTRQLSQAELAQTSSVQQPAAVAKVDEVQDVEPAADEADSSIDLLAQRMMEKLGLPEQTRRFVTELARAARQHCAELQHCMDDPAQIVPTLLSWAKDSPQCEQALPQVQAALQGFLRGRAEGVAQARARDAALAAVEDFVLEREHLIMLLDGRLFELIKSIAGSAAAAALDELTAGIQQRVQGAVDFAERVEKTADSAKSTMDAAGNVVGEGSIGSALFEKALEAGRSAPVIGPLFAAIDGLYSVLKGAKANKEAYAVFRRQLEADVQLLDKANVVPGVAETIGQVQDVVQRATAFVEKAEQRGLLGQLWHAFVKDDKAELKVLGQELQEAMGRLQTDLLISVATSPHDREKVAREVGEQRKDVEQQIERAIQQDQENEGKLRQRIEQVCP
jgi:hypothetical protein